MAWPQSLVANSEGQVVRIHVQSSGSSVCRSGIQRIRSASTGICCTSPPLDPAPEKGEISRFDLGGVVIPTLPILPLAGPKAAFDVDLRTFAEILRGDFSEAAKEDHAVPLG